MCNSNQLEEMCDEELVVLLKLIKYEMTERFVASVEEK